MSSQHRESPWSRVQVLDAVIEAAGRLTEDWDHEFSAPISADTWLVADLGCQSLDIIVLTAQLSRRLERTDIPFERLLLLEGKPVTDVSLRAMANFLWEHAKGSADSPGAAQGA